GRDRRNRPGPQAVADAPGRLAWEAPGHVLLGVRAGDDVNRLLLLLQRTDDVAQVSGLIREIGADNVFAGRADAQAIRRLVVRPEGETLPHGRRFRVGHLLAIVHGVLAICDLLHPVGEAAHELPVIVSLAGGEVEPT